MILTTVKISDFDDFWSTFSTRGAAKRKEHGCRGSRVFRDPGEADRIWVLFDWDKEGFEGFLADPEVQPIFQAAGLQGPPVLAEPAGELDS